nr:uncharacterized protein LOC109147218 [Ipomoea batatas]
MAKAYDRVSWFFLTSVIRRLGFCEVWIDLVYRAVSNVRYSVIVNGVKEGFFHIILRLHQGDPLSPSLFILAAEVLSVYLVRVYEDVTIPRFTQLPRTPRIHHLAYADDVIIFSTNRQQAIQKVIAALKDYEEISGQLVKAKCLSWQRRVLSKGGKAVLITSVLQALPLHLFAAFDDVPPEQQLGATVTGGNNGTWLPLSLASLVDVRVGKRQAAALSCSNGSLRSRSFYGGEFFSYSSVIKQQPAGELS